MNEWMDERHEKMGRFAECILGIYYVDFGELAKFFFEMIRLGLMESK